MVTPIRNVLTAVAGRWGLGGLSWFVEVQRQWPTVVGPALAEVSRPERIRGDALVVVATQPVAAQELRLRQRAIIRALPGAGRVPRLARLLVTVRARLPGPPPARSARRASGQQTWQGDRAQGGARAKRC